jgi:hypothetical protein
VNALYHDSTTEFCHDGECGQCVDVETYDTGATASKLDVDWSLLDWSVLRRMAKVMAAGVVTHGRDNWRRGLPPYVIQNHMVEHFSKWLSGDTSEDHLAHAMCRLMMLASRDWEPQG